MSQTLEGTFNPAFHFLGLIQKAMDDGITRHCVHLGTPDVYLVPAEQSYYTTKPNIGALKALCFAEPFDLSVELIPDWHPASNQDIQAGRMLIHQKHSATTAELMAFPLTELLWYVAIHSSNGQLLQGHHAETPVRLLASPDFLRLYHRECDLVVAAFMLKQSAPLTLVAEKTGVPLAQVYDFYNACVMLDLVVVEQANVFNPADHLLGLLVSAKADQQARRCVLAGQAPLYIAPDQGSYYSEADSAGIATFCSAPLTQLDIALIENSGEEVVQVGRMVVRRKKEGGIPKMPARPLSELIFRAAFYASQGRLLAGYKPATPVRLKAWPDKDLLKESAAIKEERYFFLLAAYMTTNTASLPDIAAATQLQLAQVINFHNACAIIGLLEA
ncbi:MAG: hypothetical protein NTV43_05150 [Methylococcales bacterium]|nr:hypothetical protein [Methylococcales bacterium]